MMSYQNVKVIGLIVALCSLFSIAAFGGAVAQNQGTLTVSVSEKGGVIPKAVVVLTSSVSEQTYRRITNERGIAQFPDIPTGEYKLNVTFIGFAAHRQDVTVGSSDQNIDVTLTLAKFSDTVTITTANRREELLRNVAEPTTVLDAADILDTGARTAKDVLQELAGSGVVVHQGGGQGHVSINGISNKGILILIDGRRWLGRDGTGNVNLDDLDMSQFERIEVVKGAGSALYGSDALGGVINFISRKPEQTGVTNSILFSYGENNDTKFSDTLSFRQNNVRGSVTGSYRSIDSFDLNPDDDQTQGRGDETFYAASGNIAVDATDRITVKGLFDYNRREVENFFFAGATQLGGVYNSQQERTRILFSPEVDIAIADTTLLNVRYDYNKYERNETRVYPVITEVQDPWIEWNNQINATVSHGWNLGERFQTFQAGYEFRNEKMERANLVFPETGANETERDINVFWAQNEFQLTDQFRVTAGFRYDDYSDFGEEFSPKVSAMFAVNDENRLRFSYGHGFRAPSFGELFIDLGFFFKGNPDLEPEISDNFTFGYTYTGSLAVGSVDFFYNKVQNGIIFDLSGFPFTYKNEEEFTVRGLNTEVTFNLPMGLSPTVAYTFKMTEDEDGEELLSFDKHSGFVKLLWSNPRLGTRANIRGQFYDEQQFGNGRFRPRYQLWDFQANKQLFVTGVYNVGVFFQIDNLLDETDIFTRDANDQPIPGELNVWEPGRTFLFGITVDMDFNR